jgi:hypothetical protein
MIHAKDVFDVMYKLATIWKTKMKLNKNEILIDTLWVFFGSAN